MNQSEEAQRTDKRRENTSATGVKGEGGRAQVTIFLRWSLSLSPAFPHSRQKLLLVPLHLPDQRLIAGVFMRRRPEDHFCEHRREVDSFSRQPVNQLPSIGRIRPGSDDSVSDQFAQAVRQDVRGYAFVALHEFLIGTEPAQHHVADDQERPAIAQHLDRSIQWTLRPPLQHLRLRHIQRITIITCI
jgi:hypothetical protein